MDDASLIPWSDGKPLVWDVTVPDTFAQLHITATAANAEAAANKAASSKASRYTKMSHTHKLSPSLWKQMVHGIQRRLSLYKK